MRLHIFFGFSDAFTVITFFFSAVKHYMLCMVAYSGLFVHLKLKLDALRQNTSGIESNIYCAVLTNN